MKYMLLIHHGGAATPNDPEAWAKVSEEEQREIREAWGQINEVPGVTPGMRIADPGSATTVRVENGETLTTDGPYASVKEALGGWLFFEADDLDAAIELASKIPSARQGGGVEVRPVIGDWS